MHAFKTGKALLFNGYAADICYTSPSLRCVQSADGILSGMDRKAVPMQLVSVSGVPFAHALNDRVSARLGAGSVRMLPERLQAHVMFHDQG